jgi:ceramide glucosyltransferase
MHNILELAALGAASASLALYATLTTSFALGWSKQSVRTPDRCPRVTVFKPVAGIDDDLRANLESFARIDYPSFELLIGVADPDDDGREGFQVSAR